MPSRRERETFNMPFKDNQTAIGSRIRQAEQLNTKAANVETNVEAD